METDNICVCDIDGTICEYNTVYDKFVMEHKLDTKINIEAYDTVSRYGSTKLEMQDVWNEWLHQDMFAQLKKIEGSEKINKYNPIFVTARPLITRKTTLSWLEANEFKFQSVIFTSDKTSIDIIDRVNLCFEDHPTQAISFACRGIRTYLFDRSYNRNFYHPNVIRVKNWFEIS